MKCSVCLLGSFGIVQDQHFLVTFFCLDDIPTVVSELLMSPIITMLLSISSFGFLNIYLIYLGALMLAAYIFMTVIFYELTPLTLYNDTLCLLIQFLDYSLFYLVKE